MLAGRGIGTALDLRDAPDGWVRQRMGVTGLRTVHELRGIACHELETQPAAKQTTCCSRSFSRAISDREQVRDAIVSFAERTAEKIRRSDQVCGNLQVSIATDSFDTAAPQYTDRRIGSVHDANRRQPRYRRGSVANIRAPSGARALPTARPA